MVAQPIWGAQESRYLHPVESAPAPDLQCLDDLDIKYATLHVLTQAEDMIEHLVYETLKEAGTDLPEAIRDDLTEQNLSAVFIARPDLKTALDELLALCVERSLSDYRG